MVLLGDTVTDLSCTTLGVLPVPQPSCWHRESSSILRTPAASIFMQSFSTDLVPSLSSLSHSFPQSTPYFPFLPFPSSSSPSLFHPSLLCPSIFYLHTSPPLSQGVKLCSCQRAASLTKEQCWKQSLPRHLRAALNAPNIVPHVHVTTALLNSGTPKVLGRALLCITQSNCSDDNHSWAQLCLQHGGQSDFPLLIP